MADYDIHLELQAVYLLTFYLLQSIFHKVPTYFEVGYVRLAKFHIF